MISKRATFAALSAIAASAPAHAAVTISTAATQNMNCANGTCAPTATNAVLNASDLEGYLSQFGNVHVVTTGSGVEAKDIVVDAHVSTPNSTSLTLDAHKAITVDAAVSIGAGTAELELQSDTLDTGATLVVGRKGHITFRSLSDTFGINGGIFTLVGSVKGLAAAAANDPSGALALANSYDAANDGTYSSSPIPVRFTGTLEGLGNAIYDLLIGNKNYIKNYSWTGLFDSIGKGGAVRDLRLPAASVVVSGEAAILAGINYGLLFDDSVSGRVEGANYVGGVTARNFRSGTIAASGSSAIVTLRKGGSVGGIVGWNEGAISNSLATGAVSTGRNGDAGGIAGENVGKSSSFATDSARAGNRSLNGGLIGEQAGGQNGVISNSYSTGSVAGGKNSHVGGLIGGNDTTGQIASSYSTGLVTGDHVGGFAGLDDGTITDAYWDTDASGITDPSQGAGRPRNDPGITGLTTQQLQSGLPTGFDLKVWAENPNINNGLPYLIANPPPK